MRTATVTPARAATEWDWLDGYLRFRNPRAAKGRAARLTNQTGLAWTTEYRQRTNRFHVVIDREPTDVA